MRSGTVTLRLACLVVALGASSCTLVVVDDLQNEPAPCAAVGDCAAGFGCVAGNCEATPAAALPDALTIGPAGGTALGPDGVTVTLPPDATPVELVVAIERASATTIARGVELRSSPYTLTPVALLSAPAVVAIPTPEDCAGCAVWVGSLDDEPWEPLSPAGAPTGALAGTLTLLGGIVALGVEAP